MTGLATTWLGKQRIDLEACGSTNDEAARLARAGANHGTIVISERQTAGRGRDGHVWKSPAGGLYLSAILRPPLSMTMVPAMTLAIGIGVCDAIRACGVGGTLKWPNDVLVADRKIAGVLVEAQSQSGRLETAIVGIGINIQRVALDEVATIATSIDDEVDGDPIERDLVIERVLVHVERWIDRYIAIGLSSVIPAWHERMAIGLMARATVDGVRVAGDVIGLDPEGSLLLRGDGSAGAPGALFRVRSGDVEVRPRSSLQNAEPATAIPAC